MGLIRVQNLTKEFNSFKALNDVSFEIEHGKQYAFRGPSGSGKSTLLYMLGGLDRPTTGELLIEGHQLNQLSDDELARFRNEYVGFVFQFHFLLPSINCMDNILLPAQIGQKNIKQIKNTCIDLAQTLGVSSLLKKYPYELSGGEQQRINLIRALSLRPKLLLCDEPTGSLDSKNSNIVIELLGKLSKDFDSTLIVVTHDDNISHHFSGHLYLKDGKISSHIN